MSSDPNYPGLVKLDGSGFGVWVAEDAQKMPVLVDATGALYPGGSFTAQIRERDAAQLREWHKRLDYAGAPGAVQRARQLIFQVLGWSSVLTREGYPISPARVEVA